MRKGTNEFAVSILSFWIAVILMLVIPDRFNLIVIIGFVVAIACGLLADKFSNLF
jgi:hypothetical protein